MNVLVTGANRGLGFYLVKVGLERGYRMFAGTRDISERNIRKLTELHHNYGDQLTILQLDVADEESVRDASFSVDTPLDAIINNAGILNGRTSLIEDLDISELQRALEINAVGPARVIKYFMPLLKQGTNQSIINVSSAGGSLTYAYGGDFPYGLSKVALNMLSHKLHVSLQREGIQVLAVHPGWVRTDMGGMMAADHPRDVANNIYQLINREVPLEPGAFFVDHRGNPMDI